MNISNFTQLVRRQATAMEGAASKILDFTVGSILRAVTESVSATAMWLQSLILGIFAMSRAATSVGEDLDSWMADFTFYRGAAESASNNVIFGRFSTGQAAEIKTGDTVETSDGQQKFMVVADLDNPRYNPDTDKYTMTAVDNNVAIPVMAITPGSAGNVGIGSINVLTTPIVGVDYVRNDVEFANGIDAESDDDFRARFQRYISSISEATMLAVQYAVTSVALNLVAGVVENEQFDGTTLYGHFYVVVDDGTGNPDSGVLANVSNAIDVVRPLTASFTVHGPQIIDISVDMTVTVLSGFDVAVIKNAVCDKVTNYINARALGEGDLPYTRMIQVAYSVPGVQNVTLVTINGGTSDIVITNKQVPKANIVTVS